MMKKILFISTALTAAFLLSGCTAISYEHYRHPRRPVVLPPHPGQVVEVIQVPHPRPRGPLPRWRRHPRH